MITIIYTSIPLLSISTHPFFLLLVMDQSIDKASICSPIGSDSDNSQGSRVSRKRARDSAKAQCFEEQFDINDDGRPKTRRVNPQRLALRLGPELVAEMEALIVPGAKMPTFAVRKDFQERYCVDRRHIYDYFHSRGKDCTLHKYDHL